MENLDIEQVKILIETLTNKTFFDYLPVLLSAISPLLALIMSLYFFNKQSKHIMNEKVIGKDVEKLYEAADSFFEYSDSISLFFSMMEKKLLVIKSNEPMKKVFKEQCENATNDVFKKFKSVHKAAFLLRTLGENDTAVKIEEFNEEAVKLRKKLLGIVKWEERDQLNEELESGFQLHLKERQKYLKDERNNCLVKIAECKKRIKVNN